EYYFEEDAKKLWTKMSKRDRLQIRVNWCNDEYKRHWLRALEHRTALDWEQITHNARGYEYFMANRKGIPYFLKRLQDRDVRYECIATGIDFELLRPLDLYFCLHQLKVDELNDVFTRLPKDTMHEVFAYFLQWPLQSVFLDMVKGFKAPINENIFLSLICLLLDKLKCGWEDYEYEELLKQFWKELSSEYSSVVEKRGILNRIVNYVLNAPVPFNVRDFQTFISDEYQKEKTEVDGEVCTFLESFNPWLFQS
ncbi:uncharacterized protein NPIL_571361, partial [Nephila pilipes]